MTIEWTFFLSELMQNPILLVVTLLNIGVIIVNGATDAPNAIATAVSTRAMKPRHAIIMAAVFNFLGLLLVSLVSTAVAHTIFSMVDFGGNSHQALTALMAAMVAIIVWGAAAWWFGIPTSQSHSLIAGLTGAAIAVRYLLQLGHRDLVFLGGRADSLTRVQRVRGFRRALREHGLSGRVLPAPPDTRELRQWAYEQALALFGERTLPHAVLAFSDLTALRILEAAEERGIRVPEDLSLVGYDNVSYAAIPRIHLTTVSQHKFQQGRIAVERLLCQIQGDRRPTADLLQPELVVRSTCAPRTQGGRTL